MVLHFHSFVSRNLCTSKPYRSLFEVFSIKFGNTLQTYLKQSHFLSRTLTNFLINSSLVCKWWKMILSHLINGSFNTLAYVHEVIFVLGGQTFFRIVVYSVSTVLYAKNTGMWYKRIAVPREN